MAQSDFSASATAENNIDSPKALFPQCLQLPGGDGGGFHVAKGKQGASWNPATSRPGTCRGEAFAWLAFGLGFLFSASRMTTTGTRSGEA